MYVPTHSQELTKAIYSMLRGDGMKHKSLTSPTNELHTMMFKGEEEISLQKGPSSAVISPGRPSPPRTSGPESLLGTRAHVPNGSKPDFTSVQPSFLLAIPGHSLFPLFLSGERRV